MAGKWGVGAIALALLVASASIAYAGNDVIVQFKPGVTPAQKDQALLHAGAQKGLELGIVNAVSAKLPALNSAAARALLAANPDVNVVEDNAVVYASKPGGNGKPAPTPPPETTPWGTARVGGPAILAATVKVAVLDTGIDLDHPDLLGLVHAGPNYISSSNPPDDDNGHGSHVAGTIGAIDNDIGSLGIAQGPLELWAVKVLNRRGSGTWEGILAGIGWAAGQMDVISMSLGGTGNGDANSTLRQAIVAARNAGTVVVVAAGNENDLAINHVPGGYPESFTVGATDSNNVRASFSNYGNRVDIAAPGVGIYSTYKGAGYATLSGTSMSTPHVSACAALYIGAHPSALVSQVGNALLSGATASAWSDSTGWPVNLVHVP